MPRGQPTVAVVVRLAVVVSAVSAVVVLSGGTAAWYFERDSPATTFQTWGDGLWWALTTLTTTGYGDHVPVTVGGRFIAGAIMIIGVAVLGAVAAVVALTVAWAVAMREESALEAEAESLERRIEGRLGELEARLVRIEDALRSLSGLDR